jgi:choline-glycine betaine transporter
MNIRAFIIILSSVIAAFSAYLGFQWIHVGQGLNPYIAFPLAFAVYYIPYLYFSSEVKDLECQYEDLLEYMEKRE